MALADKEFKGYWILDSRAAFLDLTGELDDWSKYVITGDTAQECCKMCNNDEFGGGCVVADAGGRIRWDWYATGKWRVPDES